MPETLLQEPPVIPIPLIGRIWRGVRDPLEFLASLEADYGDIVTLRRGRSYAIYHPDYVKHVLQDHYTNYEKGEKYRAALGPLMGNGLFTSEGAFWLRQRRIAQGAFQKAHLAVFGDQIMACIEDAMPEWERKARANEPVALRESLTELMLRGTLRMLFGVDAQGEMPVLVKALNGAHSDIKFGRLFLPVKLPAWVPTPSRRRFSRSLATIDEFIYRIIRERQAAADPGTDLVGLLVRAQDPETGERMDPGQLRDEVATMIHAGHDTVTDASLWTLVLLARHPEIQARVHDEIERIAGAAGPSAATLPAMDLLGRVYREALRLYPPAWGFARQALQPDTFGQYTVPAGGFVIIAPYVIHRSPRWWDRPEAFDPDRFLPANSASRPKFAYVPFGSGPRMCIGSNVALLEGPLVVASVLRRFEISLPLDQDMSLSPRISLRPKRTIRLQLRARR